MAPPVEVLEQGALQLLQGPPGAAAVDQLGIELEAVGARNLEGNVLIDIALPLDGAPGQRRSLVLAHTDSLGEQIQRAFPDVRVVKTLNTVFVDVMVDPSRGRGLRNVFVSGDEMGAKAIVAALLGEFGWLAESIVDLGDIRTAPGVPLRLLPSATVASAASAAA